MEPVLAVALMETAKRLPIVGVMGSGREGHEARSRPLGEWLATEDVHLLTGGGVMEAVSRAFFDVPNRRGLVLGVIRGDTDGSKKRDPNPWVEIPIQTHLPLSGKQGTDPMSRNHINVLSSTVVIALPGAFGTASEVALALRYKRPLIAYLEWRDQIPDLPENALVETDLESVKDFVRSRIQERQ